MAVGIESTGAKYDVQGVVDVDQIRNNYRHCAELANTPSNRQWYGQLR